MIRAAAACLLATAALFPVVVSADSGHYLTEQMIINPTGQPVITPAQAEKLVQAIWQARWEARYPVDPINDFMTQAAAEFFLKASLSTLMSYGRRVRFAR
jgi:hypothetical protein